MPLLQRPYNTLTFTGVTVATDLQRLATLATKKMCLFRSDSNLDETFHTLVNKPFPMSVTRVARDL